MDTTIEIKRTTTGHYYLPIADITMNYQELVVIMQRTERVLPQLSKSIRNYIETLAEEVYE